MKWIRSVIVGFVVFLMASISFLPVVKAEGTNTGGVSAASGENTTQIYRYRGGMIASVFDPVNNQETRYFAGHVDSVVRNVGGVETLIAKYSYDGGGKLVSIFDPVNQNTTYFNPEGKRLLTANDAAEGDVSAVVKAAVEQGFNAAKSIILGGVFGITSLVEYSAKGEITSESYFAVGAKGSKVASGTLEADIVVEASRVEYVDGKRGAVYNLWASINPITGKAFASAEEMAQFIEEHPDRKDDIYWGNPGVAGAAWGVKVQEYHYNGNELEEVVNYDLSGKAITKEVYENGKIMEMQRINSDGTTSTLEKYVYSGARLIAVENWTEKGNTVDHAVSTTFMDEYGRESYMAEGGASETDGKVTGRWYYNDSGADVVLEITDPTAIQQLRDLKEDDRAATNVRIESDNKAYVTVKAGQTKFMASYAGSDETTGDVTYFDQNNKSMITVNACDLSGLTTTGTGAPRDPIATGVLSVDAMGQIVMTIDMSTMYDPTGKVSRAELKDMYDPDGDGKATVLVQTLDSVKLAALRAAFLANESKTLEASEFANDELYKELMSKALAGNTTTLFWNWTAQKNGQMVIFAERIVVENYIDNSQE